MKLKILIISFLFFACKEDSSLSVSNELDNVLLQNIYWGEFLVSTDLISGQEAEIELDPLVYDLPKSAYLRFEMKVANRRIGLRTVKEIEIKKDENILIEIYDSMEVTVN